MPTYKIGNIPNVSTLMVQIKTTANKGDVFMVGSFFGGDTKKIFLAGFLQKIWTVL